MGSAGLLSQQKTALSCRHTSIGVLITARPVLKPNTSASSKSRVIADKGNTRQPALLGGHTASKFQRLSRRQLCVFAERDTAFPAAPAQRAQAALQAAVKRLGQCAVVLSASAAVFLNSCTAASAEAIVRFPASPIPAVFAAQKTLVEAWTIVQETFVDSNFSGRDWEGDLADALLAAYQAPDGGAAYRQIQLMLAKLQDPFTRIVPPQEYADFRVSSDGEVQGVGLLIAADPDSKALVVLAPIQGGPADRAGIRSGDQVLTIDGKSTSGWDGDRAAQSLRGRQGSSVSVRFARITPQIPGVPGRPEPAPRVEYKQVQLRREKLELSSVFATTVTHHDHLLGYIRLINFSSSAAGDMRRAIASLEGQGAEGYILDLRNNPGGLVRSGLDIARLFLDGEATVFNVEGRTAGEATGTTQRVALSNMAAMTRQPMAVLVNSGSASASEILAGALRDNHRAELVGDANTYGKGKIQSVFELDDGSALFVTVARYKTPMMGTIDQVGIAPDLRCGLPGGMRITVVPGIPVGPMASGNTGGVLQALQQDSCVISAENFLDLQVKPVAQVK